MRDEWFIRGDVPMTKSEVRAVSLSKLELDADAVLLDIGAGTGSVSVEAALCHPVRKICAFEKRREAAELFEQNWGKGGIPEEKMILIEGEAPEAFAEALQSPFLRGEFVTHAFIGGSSGSMAAILDALLGMNGAMRVVINVIALESLSSVLSLLAERGIAADIVSVQVARAKTAGAYHLMQGQNPVYIISFGGKEE